jgi:hypothetical protein
VAYAVRPAVRAKGTVRPSAKPMMASRRISEWSLCFSRWLLSARCASRVAALVIGLVSFFSAMFVVVKRIVFVLDRRERGDIYTLIPPSRDLYPDT